MAIINHAPSGCTAMAPGVDVMNGQLAAKRGVTNNTVFIGTDMNEEDTIFGAVEALQEVALEVYRRYRPEAIFIGASCVTGIIGEDIDSVVEWLKGELPIPVAAVHCEGFFQGSGHRDSIHPIMPC